MKDDSDPPECIGYEAGEYGDDRRPIVLWRRNLYIFETKEEALDFIARPDPSRSPESPGGKLVE